MEKDVKEKDVKETDNKAMTKDAGKDVAVYDVGDDAGAGLEGMTRDEYSVPFLIVLDQKSRHVKPVDAGGIPNAAAGMIMNTATMQLFDGKVGIPFVPVHRDHRYTEWIPKNPDGSGGGFIGIRPVDDPLVVRLRKEKGQFGKLPTSDGHELVETFDLYGMYVVDGVPYPSLIAFSSTQIKKYRNMMTRVKDIVYQGANGIIRPPLWAHQWMVGSQWEKKGRSGQEGFGWRIWLKEEPPLKSRFKTDDPIYLAGREFYESIQAGRVTAAERGAETATDEEIPF